jgi:hypothetical protein
MLRALSSSVRVPSGAYSHYVQTIVSTAAQSRAANSLEVMSRLTQRRSHAESPADVAVLPYANPMPWGLLPTATVSTTLLVSESMTDTVFDSEFET